MQQTMIEHAVQIPPLGLSGDLVVPAQATVGAVVSRGGRPDLAGIALAQVKAPTLLIVGGDDYEVIRLNRFALGEMQCQKQLSIVPGASHLFEERGTLEQVSAMALKWF